mgnify:CR=1 FL=1
MLVKENTNGKGRTYIRKKRCFLECKAVIGDFLRNIYTQKGFNYSDADINADSMKYAHQVEAQCWSPKLRVTDEEYRQLMHLKTAEICIALANTYNIGFYTIQPQVIQYVTPIYIHPPKRQIPSITNILSIDTWEPPVADHIESQTIV